MSDNATYEANIKAVGKGDSGEFTSIVSVFGNVDLTSDIVVAGAYKNNIETWAKSEDNLPVIWSHQWQDPDYNIGFVKEMEELEARDPRLKGEAFDTGGLLVVGQIDLDDSASKARQVWKLVKGARVRNWSFHYAVEQASMGAKNGERVRFLEQLAITEVGPTHLGANPATHTVEAKAVAETLGISAEELTLLRDMLAREKQAPVTEPDSDESHAVDPRLGEERYQRYL